MDRPRKVAKPARGQLNRETKCPCRCIRGKYIRVYMYCYFCFCLYTWYRVYFLYGNMCTRARFTAVSTYRYVTTAVCMYTCMVITYSKGKDQPGKVANSARGQLAEQRKLIIPCPLSRLRIWPRETGRQSRPTSACSSPYSG